MSLVRYTSTSSTIYALSTHLTRSALGVIRITGPQSLYVYQQLTQSRRVPKPRVTSVQTLKAGTGAVLDEALTVFFKAPYSYTGEDSLELHVHGGVAIIKRVLAEIGRLHDPGNGKTIRYAENGEFSKRSFINGRFDLTELEGVREMIDAETETQRAVAVGMMMGKNKRVFKAWRHQTLSNIAKLTTIIDFGDDIDSDDTHGLIQHVKNDIQALTADINQFLVNTEKSQILLDGIRLTLIGPPNAGKSSLLNQISDTDAAIVSSIAGTTRDSIQVPLDINGYKVILGDTAGIRSVSGADEIEAQGITKAKTKAASSDVVLVMLPADYDFASDDFNRYMETIKLDGHGPRIIGVLNKQDLATPHHIKAATQQFQSVLNVPVVAISCKTGTGIPELLQMLTTVFREISSTTNTDPIIISERVKDLLKNDIVYGFDQFQHWISQDDVVLATESLQQAVQGIGKITGEAIGIEEILGVVFSSFCIGK